MKLSGWTRILVVLSIIWAVFICGLASYQFYFSSSTKTTLLVEWMNIRPIHEIKEVDSLIVQDCPIRVI